MNFYNAYRVHGSKIRATFYYLDTENHDEIDRCLVYPSHISGWSTSVTVVNRSERTYGRHRHLQAGGYKKFATVKNYMSTKRMFGVKSIIDDDFTGGVSSDPTKQWYWLVGHNSVNDANYTSGEHTVHIIVDIVYYTEFCMIKTVGPS